MYYPMAGNVSKDGTFTGPLKSLRRVGDYIFEPIGGTGIFTEIDPLKNGGIGSWTQLDGTSGVAWIDLPDVTGVIFTGRQAAGHCWYSNSGVGNYLCTHGVPPPVQITGPVSTDGYPALFLFNPSDLAGRARRAANRLHGRSCCDG